MVVNALIKYCYSHRLEVMNNLHSGTSLGLWSYQIQVLYILQKSERRRHSSLFFFFYNRGMINVTFHDYKKLSSLFYHNACCSCSVFE